MLAQLETSLKQQHEKSESFQSMQPPRMEIIVDTLNSSTLLTLDSGLESMHKIIREPMTDIRDPSKTYKTFKWTKELCFSPEAYNAIRQKCTILETQLGIDLQDIVRIEQQASINNSDINNVYKAVRNALTVRHALLNDLDAAVVQYVSNLVKRCRDAHETLVRHADKASEYYRITMERYKTELDITTGSCAYGQILDKSLADFKSGFVSKMIPPGTLATDLTLARDPATCVKLLDSYRQDVERMVPRAIVGATFEPPRDRDILRLETHIKSIEDQHRQVSEACAHNDKMRREYLSSLETTVENMDHIGELERVSRRLEAHKTELQCGLVQLNARLSELKRTESLQTPLRAEKTPKDVVAILKECNRWLETFRKLDGDSESRRTSDAVRSRAIALYASQTQALKDHVTASIVNTHSIALRRFADESEKLARGHDELKQNAVRRSKDLLASVESLMASGNHVEMRHAIKKYRATEQDFRNFNERLSLLMAVQKTTFLQKTTASQPYSSYSL